jgi:transcriptional regulator with XRE-family HTH domain
MADLYEYSIPEILHLMGERFKRYRMNADLTQLEVAEQAGLTIKTVHKFESGAMNNMSLGTFILLLKAIGLLDNIDNVLPELPESPYLYRTETKKVQRIRHKNHEKSTARPIMGE